MSYGKTGYYSYLMLLRMMHRFGIPFQNDERMSMSDYGYYCYRVLDARGLITKE